MAVTELSTDFKTIKALTPKFPYVFAWCKAMNHTRQYTAEQLTLAYRSKSSKFVTYQKEDGTWANTKALSPASIKMLNEELPTKLLKELTEGNNE